MSYYEQTLLIPLDYEKAIDFKKRLSAFQEIEEDLKEEDKIDLDKIFIEKEGKIFVDVNEIIDSILLKIFEEIMEKGEGRTVNSGIMMKYGLGFEKALERLIIELEEEGLNKIENPEIRRKAKEIFTKEVYKYLSQYEMEKVRDYVETLKKIKDEDLNDLEDLIIEVNLSNEATKFALSFAEGMKVDKGILSTDEIEDGKEIDSKTLRKKLFNKIQETLQEQEDKDEEELEEEAEEKLKNIKVKINYSKLLRNIFSKDLPVEPANFSFEELIYLLTQEEGLMLTHVMFILSKDYLEKTGMPKEEAKITVLKHREKIKKEYLKKQKL